MSTLGPILAARRQLLLDAFTEYLTGKGAKHAADYATELVALAWAQDWRPPHPASDDRPPPPSYSTKAGRARAREIFEQARAETRSGSHPADD